MKNNVEENSHRNVYPGIDSFMRDELSKLMFNTDCAVCTLRVNEWGSSRHFHDSLRWAAIQDVIEKDEGVSQL